MLQQYLDTSFSCYKILLMLSPQVTVLPESDAPVRISHSSKRSSGICDFSIRALCRVAPTNKQGQAPDMAATAVKSSADQNVGRTAELHDIIVGKGLLQDLDIVHKHPVRRVLHRDRASGHADMESDESGGAQNQNSVTASIYPDYHHSRCTRWGTC